MPDLEIPFVAPPSDEDKNLKDRFTFREKDLTRHLENISAKKAKKNAKAKSSDKSDKTDKADEARTMIEKDNQMRLALEMVKTLPKIREIR